MMSKIELMPSEEALLKQISLKYISHEVLKESCQAAGELTKMLLERNAIPKIRVEYFTNPEFNISQGGRKSRKEIFEGNGTKGDKILFHGNFLKYLKYFIYGSDLPANVISEFVKQKDEDDLPAIARNLVRRYRLNPKIACEEFYKLCLECGLEWESRSVRDSVMAVKLN